MPCLLALLSVAFPRVAIVLLWLFSNFFTGVYQNMQNSMFHFHLAMALLKQGDKEGARQEANKALANAVPAEQEKIRSFVNQIG